MVRLKNYIFKWCNVSETHQLHIVYFAGVMCHVSRIFAVTKINKKNNFANIKIVRERREKVWEQLNVS